MSHITKNKTKTLSRVRRIKGQVEAIERALEGEGEFTLDYGMRGG